MSDEAGFPFGCFSTRISLTVQGPDESGIMVLRLRTPPEESEE